jgi:hypothetical protein
VADLEEAEQKLSAQKKRDKKNQGSEGEEENAEVEARSRQSEVDSSLNVVSENAVTEPLTESSSVRKN